MLKGVQKKMIVVKTSAESCFESACFVLRARGARGNISEEAMLHEARRIIAQSEGDRGKKKRFFKKYPLRFALIAFFVGFALGALGVLSVALSFGSANFAVF